MNFRRAPISLIVITTLLMGVCLWLGRLALQPAPRGSAPSRFAFRVTGPSMMPAFAGETWRGNCPRCDVPLICSIPYLPRQQGLTCFNCGQREIGIDSGQLTLGDRVELDANAVMERWLPVAYETTAREPVNTIKRVIGLPNERIAFKSGDVYANGLLIRKSWKQFLNMRLLVHDSGTHSTCWMPWETQASQWQQDGTGWMYSMADTGAQDDLDASWRMVSLYLRPAYASRPPAQDVRVPVLDFYPSNQDLGRPPLLPVRDVMIEATFDLEDASGFCLLLRDGSREFQATLQDGRCELLENGRSLVGTTLEDAGSSQQLKRTMSLTLCDGTLFVCLEQTVVHRHTVESDTTTPVLPQIQFGARGRQVFVRRVRVWRDLHYVGPAGELDWSAPRATREDEYFVVGDNLPVSVDSRRGPHELVQRKQIRGSIRKHADPAHSGHFGNSSDQNGKN